MVRQIFFLLDMKALFIDTK